MGDVQTHLEPLERPLGARPCDELADERARADIARVVRELTGRDANLVRLLSTDAGRVVFLTLDVGSEQSLMDAHELAGRLEDELRRQISGIAEVVVHTEP